MSVYQCTKKVTKTLCNNSSCTIVELFTFSFREILSIHYTSITTNFSLRGYELNRLDDLNLDGITSRTSSRLYFYNTSTIILSITLEQQVFYQLSHTFLMLFKFSLFSLQLISSSSLQYHQRLIRILVYRIQQVSNHRCESPLY